MLLFFISGFSIYLYQRASIETNIASMKQLKHLYQKVKSTEDFVKTNKSYSFVKNTVGSNNGSLYDILPKEILYRTICNSKTRCKNQWDSKEQGNK